MMSNGVEWRFLPQFLGSNSRAMELYEQLDIKQIQNDTLSHLILSRAATFSLAALGDLQMMTACVSSSDIYTSNGTEVSGFTYYPYLADHF